MDNNAKLLDIKDKKIAISCPTYEEARNLMLLFARNRITWRLGVSAETKTNWEKHGSETCYTLDYVGISYADKNFYENNEYQVVSLKDFLVDAILDINWKRITKDTHLMDNVVGMDENADTRSILVGNLFFTKESPNGFGVRNGTIWMAVTHYIIADNLINLPKE